MCDISIFMCNACVHLHLCHINDSTEAKHTETTVHTYIAATYSTNGLHRQQHPYPSCMQVVSGVADDTWYPLPTSDNATVNPRYMPMYACRDSCVIMHLQNTRIMCGCQPPCTYTSICMDMCANAYVCLQRPRHQPHYRHRHHASLILTVITIIAIANTIHPIMTITMTITIVRKKCARA